MNERNLILCVLVVSLARTVAAQNPAAVINVDADANRRKISPLIYGMSFAQNADDLNCPISRWGGNPTSRYNWQLNADNRGADWYFESIAYASATPGEGPDTFIAGNKALGV